MAEGKILQEQLKKRIWLCLNIKRRNSRFYGSPLKTQLYDSTPTYIHGDLNYHNNEEKGVNERLDLSFLGPPPSQSQWTDTDTNRNGQHNITNHLSSHPSLTIFCQRRLELLLSPLFFLFIKLHFSFFLSLLSFSTCSVVIFFPPSNFFFLSAPFIRPGYLITFNYD